MHSTRSKIAFAVERVGGPLAGRPAALRRSALGRRGHVPRDHQECAEPRDEERKATRDSVDRDEESYRRKSGKHRGVEGMVPTRGCWVRKLKGECSDFYFVVWHSDPGAVCRKYLFRYHANVQYHMVCHWKGQLPSRSTGARRARALAPRGRVRGRESRLEPRMRHRRVCSFRGCQPKAGLHF